MKLRILLADDHEIVRRGLRALLEKHEGWEVCGEAGDGREAVEKALQLKPDVVIVDVGALLGLGFSPDDAKRLGRQLCDVGALIYVSCAGSAKAGRVIELLRRTGAREAASLRASTSAAATA